MGVVRNAFLDIGGLRASSGSQTKEREEAIQNTTNAQTGT
jgi:hypothetical protein